MRADVSEERDRPAVLKDVPPDALMNGATLIHEHLASMGHTTPPDRAGRAPLGGGDKQVCQPRFTPCRHMLEQVT